MTRRYRSKNITSTARKNRNKSLSNARNRKTSPRHSLSIAPLKAPIKSNSLSTEWFKFLIENSLDIILVTDPKGEILYASPSVKRVFGYFIEELLGTSSAEFVHPDDLTRTKRKIKDLIKSGDYSTHLEERLRHKNGKYYWIESVVTNLVSTPGFNALVFNFREISQTKRLERILSNEKEVLERASQGVPLNDNLATFLKTIEELSQGLVCSIHYLSEDYKNFIQGPSPSLPKDYLEATKAKHNGTPDFCSVVATSLKPFWASEIKTNLQYKNISEICEKYNLKAGYSFPIFSTTEKLVGVATFYYNEIKEPIKEELELINRALSIIGMLIKREQDQYQLLQNQKMLKEISASIPGAVFQGRANENGTFEFLYISEGIKELVNYSQQDVYNNWRTNMDFVHREDQDGFYKSIFHSIKKNQPWLHDFRIYLHKDKSSKWIRGNCVPKINDNGETIWYGTLIDISNEKTNEEFLRIQNRALESAAEGIIITYNQLEDNPIIYVNKRFCDLTGFSEDEVVGKNCRFLQGEHTSKETVLKIKEAVEENKSFIGEILNYRKDGTAFWNSLVIAPVSDSDVGKITHFVGMINDITERKSAEERLQEQNFKLLKVNMELDRFVYSTSHDLRAPLTSILGLLDLTLDSSDLEEIRRFVALAKQSVVKQERIIQSILDYFRNNRSSIAKEQILLDEIIKEGFEAMKYLNNYDKIKKIIEIKGDCPFICDKNRIKILINHLLSNAMKYSDSEKDESWVKVTAEISEKAVYIEVHDNGIGIEESEEPKIFDMFYRGSVKSNGSGLGLYVAKEIIDKLAGSIEVESKVNEETCFKITIPNLI